MKTEIKYFLLPEYEQEEQYLIDMAKHGYELVSIQPRGLYVKYNFQETTDTDLIYRLDFYTGNEEESYKQMYLDYGWEYVCKLNNFYYFKKRGTDEDLEIFSDNESRFEMMKSVVSQKLLPLILILISSILIYATTVKSTNIFTILYAVIVGLDAYLIVRCLIGFIRLKRKYTY